MGVAYSSETVIGEYFETRLNIAEALFKRGFIEGLSEEDLEEIDLEELVESIDDTLSIVCENAWSGEGFYLGYEGYDWRNYEHLISEYTLLVKGHAEVHQFTRVH